MKCASRVSIVTTREVIRNHISFSNGDIRSRPSSLLLTYKNSIPAISSSSKPSSAMPHFVRYTPALLMFLSQMARAVPPSEEASSEEASSSPSSPYMDNDDNCRVILAEFEAVLPLAPGDDTPCGDSQNQVGICSSAATVLATQLQFAVMYREYGPRANFRCRDTSGADVPMCSDCSQPGKLEEADRSLQQQEQPAVCSFLFPPPQDQYWTLPPDQFGPLRRLTQVVSRLAEDCRNAHHLQGAHASPSTTNRPPKFCKCTSRVSLMVYDTDIPMADLIKLLDQAGYRWQFNGIIFSKPQPTCDVNEYNCMCGINELESPFIKLDCVAPPTWN